MRQSEIFDSYLDGKLNDEEKIGFEKQLEADPAMALALREHRSLIRVMRARAEREKLRDKLRATHENELGQNPGAIGLLKQENFAVKHGRTIAIAASTAAVVVFSAVALLSAGGYMLRQQSNQITNLNREVLELKASSEAIVEGIKKGRKVYAPANLEGSAFAVSAKGYLITSLHMVSGADSIFIQNKFTERVNASLVFSDPRLDLAVLKVDNAEVVKAWKLPFRLNNDQGAVGDRVFTLGYPRKDMVYGEGSLSAESGYANDTSMYQISIPVNPGNSGGPVLDEAGNVIGVIRGKISGAEATGFAIKSNQILKALEKAGDDSLAQIAKPYKLKRSLKGLRRSEQIRQIHPYIFNVLVYNRD
jgi:serine protease Do